MDAIIIRRACNETGQSRRVRKQSADRKRGMRTIALRRAVFQGRSGKLICIPSERHIGDAERGGAHAGNDRYCAICHGLNDDVRSGARNRFCCERLIGSDRLIAELVARYDAVMIERAWGQA